MTSTGISEALVVNLKTARALGITISQSILLRADMASPPPERRLTAILSADVAGYSLLMGRNEAATVDTLTEYRAVIVSQVERH